ncbi:MAG TPA: CBS domain-containing protein [Thermodesulfobacteriota bacterium]|nr:CBS domain-containing protein [Thermodesulfobacteriota bacterium]
MKAQEIMTKNVLSVRENTSVKEAAGIMAKNKIGAIIVETSKPTAGIWYGIFTQSDLLTRVVAEGKDLEKTKIRDVMTDGIKCAQAEDDVNEIARVMYQENVRYLPVLEGRKLIGIISTTDLFKFIFRGAEGYQEEIL